MASWTNDETLKFIQLYEEEPAIWNPKNKNYKNKHKVNDAWQRISNVMDSSITELKRKKETLMSAFRLNHKKVISSGKCGYDTYKPVWVHYNVMAAFLSDVVFSKNTQDSDEIIEETSCSEMEANVEVIEEAIEDTTLKRLSSSGAQVTSTKNQQTKSTAQQHNELHEACEQIKGVVSILSSVVGDKICKPEVLDECDLYSRLLAKKLRHFSDNDRQELMYEIDGILLKKKKNVS